MPKRDAAYMLDQRDLIAKATIESMMDFGVADTSIREVCTRAGISIGAFYTHFRGKNEAIDAALEHFVAQMMTDTHLGNSLDEFRSNLRIWLIQARKNESRKRYALGLELAGTTTKKPGDYPGISKLSSQSHERFRVSLQSMIDHGELDGQLDTAVLSKALNALLIGAVYTILHLRDEDVEDYVRDVIKAVDTLIGYRV